MIGRRGFLKALAAVAASPVLAKIPMPEPVNKIIQRTGAWATARVTDGRITAIDIISAGSGYREVPAITIMPHGYIDIEPPR